MTAEAPLLVRMRPRWLHLRNQQARYSQVDRLDTFRFSLKRSPTLNQPSETPFRMSALLRPLRAYHLPVPADGYLTAIVALRWHAWLARLYYFGFQTQNGEPSRWSAMGRANHRRLITVFINKPRPRRTGVSVDRYTGSTGLAQDMFRLAAQLIGNREHHHRVDLDLLGRWFVAWLATVQLCCGDDPSGRNIKGHGGGVDCNVESV